MIGLGFSRAYRTSVTCFPMFTTCLFIRAYHCLNVFLLLVVYFCFEFDRLIAFFRLLRVFRCESFCFIHDTNKNLNRFNRVKQLNLAFFSNRKHRDHLLQSLLHLRIHAALQKIEHNGMAGDRPQVLHEEGLVQNAQIKGESDVDTAGSTNDDDFFDAAEDCVPNLSRQDSNSSFDIISDFADEV